MNLYLVKRIGGTSWDETEGFVIAAPDALTAREMAHVESEWSAQQIGVFLQEDLSICRYLGMADESLMVPEILLTSFISG